MAESQALLALLAATTEEAPTARQPDLAFSSSMLAPLPAFVSSSLAPAPATSVAQPSTDEELAWSARLERAVETADAAVLRSELTAYVSDAHLPLGAQLCQLTAELRLAHGVEAVASASASAVTTSAAVGRSQPPAVAAAAGNTTTAASAVGAAAAAPPSSPPASTRLEQLQLLHRQLQTRLPHLSLQVGSWWRSASAESDPAAAPPSCAAAELAAAVRSVHEGLEQLRTRLVASIATLPAAVRADARALPEATRQLEAQLHRAVHGSMLGLYHRAHEAEMGALARRCHALRALLPCDLHVPAALWQLPPAAAAEAEGPTLEHSRAPTMPEADDDVSDYGEAHAAQEYGGAALGDSAQLSPARSPAHSPSHAPARLPWSGAPLAGGVASAAEATASEGTPLTVLRPRESALYGLRACGASDARLPYVSAIQLLRTITFYRTPAEKANVLLQACEEVVKCAARALSLASAASSDGGGGSGSHGPSSPAALGADDLLPLMVYVIVRSRVSSLPAELALVSDFLPAGQLHGREGYALVSLQCATRVACELTWSASLVRASHLDDDDAAS